MFWNAIRKTLALWPQTQCVNKNVIQGIIIMFDGNLPLLLYWKIGYSVLQRDVQNSFSSYLMTAH